MRFWGKIERRTRVDLFLQVSADGGNDLSGARIEAAETKSVLDIARELQDKARKIREGADEAFDRSRRTLRAYASIWRRLPTRIDSARSATMPITPCPIRTSEPTPSAS